MKSFNQELVIFPLSLLLHHLDRNILTVPKNMKCLQFAPRNLLPLNIFSLQCCLSLTAPEQGITEVSWARLRDGFKIDQICSISYLDNISNRVKLLYWYRYQIIPPLKLKPMFWPVFIPPTQDHQAHWRNNNLNKSLSIERGKEYLLILYFILSSVNGQMFIFGTLDILFSVSSGHKLFSDVMSCHCRVFSKADLSFVRFGI